MKKYLLKRQKQIKLRLNELREKVEKNEIRDEDLAAVEQEVDDLTKELEEVEQALSEVEVEEERTEDSEFEENEENDDEDEKEDEEGEERTEINHEQRNKILDAIGKGLSTRGHTSTKNKEKEIRKAFANFIVGRISEAEARSLGIEAGNGGGSANA